MTSTWQGFYWNQLFHANQPKQRSRITHIETIRTRSPSFFLYSAIPYSGIQSPIGLFARAKLHLCLSSTFRKSAKVSSPYVACSLARNRSSILDILFFRSMMLCTCYRYTAISKTITLFQMRSVSRSQLSPCLTVTPVRSSIDFLAN